MIADRALAVKRDAGMRSHDIIHVMDTLTSTIQRIAEYAELEPGWDSYGAKPISREVRQTAERFVRATAQIALPTWVSPLPNGGIMLDWETPTVLLSIDVEPDGSFMTLWVDKKGSEREYTALAGMTEPEAIALVAKLT